MLYVALHDHLRFSATVITPTDTSYCALLSITLILNLCAVSVRVELGL